MPFGKMSAVPQPSGNPAVDVALLFALVKQQQLVLQNIDAAFNRVLHAEPSKPRDGDLARADGTDWNPGAGAGLYQYQGVAWVKL